MGRKFVHRERQRIEHAARGRILIGTALLIGNRIFGCTDQVLCRTNDANHREQPDRDRKQPLTVSMVDQHAVNLRGNGIGKVVGAAAAMTAAVF